MPTLSLVETALYVDDLPRAIRFYSTVLGLELQQSDGRFCAFTVAPGQVLLIFRRGETAHGAQTPGGFIPGHDGAGPAHLAFGVRANELQTWQERLTQSGVAIESVVDWPRGSRSIFFRDPANHLVELLTPGAWANY